ncbi:MAG TPA: anti-sigma factor [Thermomicrobiales bacterium]|nr:anti-sigma factor [Thermomicrobiales bacterium]
MTTTNSEQGSTGRTVDPGLLAIGILAIALLCALAWGLSARSSLVDARFDLDSARAEIDTLREQANATAYQLTPASDAPPNANGTAFFALDGTGMIFVANLDPAPEGRSYQVWYYPSAEEEPLSGATFSVDENGLGFMLIPADVGLFTQIAVSLEPEAGSASPTGPIILTGATGGARG